MILCLAALAGLAPKPAGSALGPRYGGDLTVAIAGLPPTTDPDVVLGIATASLPGLVHETLVRVGPGGLPQPALAEEWRTAAGGREWTLRLRDGQSFHDGGAAGTEDAIRSLRRFLRSPSSAAARLAGTLEGGNAFRSGLTEELSGIAASGPLRVVLRLTDVRSFPLAPLAAPAAAVTSSAGAGAGPFIPATRVLSRRLALTAFGGHVRGRPYLDRLELVIVPPAASPMAEVQSGRVDIAPGSPGVSGLSSTILLVLDSSRPPFDSRDARAAVAGALQRDELVRHLLPGGDPAASLVVPALLPPLGTPAAPASRGATGTVAMAVDRDVPPVVSQRIVAHMRALGLSVTVQPMAPAAARASTTSARLLLFTPEVPEAGLALREVASLAPAFPPAQSALDAADRESDLDRRRAHLYRAEEALRAEACLVPVASAPVSFVLRPTVHGARVDLSGRLVLEDAWREP